MVRGLFGEAPDPARHRVAAAYQRRGGGHPARPAHKVAIYGEVALQRRAIKAGRPSEQGVAIAVGDGRTA